jgi:hypothetical protein
MATGREAGDFMVTITARGTAWGAGAATLAAVLLGVTEVGAVPAAGAYADWTLSANAGTMAIPVTGFPAATLTTNSTSPALQSGMSTYLSASTPFGQAFGSSQGMPYALLRTAAGQTPSTTTFTFVNPTPARWGFALGDIDADKVTISATGAGGGPVSAADLGFESSFNYCAVSPRPSGCGTGPFADRPVWDPATETLTGNGPDTTGAAAWFRPAVPVKTLTFTYSRLSGSPVYQVWFAATSSEVRGDVTVVPGDTPPPTTLRLLHTDGSPVLGAGGQPVTTTTDSQGGYQFSGVASEAYLVAMDPPRGFTADGPARRPADTARGDAVGVDFALREDVPPPHADSATEPDPEGTSLAIHLMSDASGDDIRVTDVTQPAEGSVTLDPSTGVATYTPPAGFTGTTTFSYTISDADGATTTATVRITVSAVSARQRPPRPPLPNVPVTG